MPRILAADIGGSKTSLMLVEVRRGERHTVARTRLASRAYADFDAALSTFLADVPAHGRHLDAAVLAVAGPVHGNAARLTNLPWTLDGPTLAARFDLPRLSIINDFVAVAESVDCLAATDIADLQPGTAVPHAPRAFIGAGTGLGQAFAVWNGRHYDVHASEGGHADFAPSDTFEAELLEWCRPIFGHVSWERLLSGAGLALIARFMAGREQASPELRAALELTDPSPRISELGLSAGDRLARQALHRFARLYGAQAGNFALATLSAGGLYLGGGIAPKLYPALADGAFIEAFHAKGRFEGWLQQVPVRVITHRDAGLLGAAALAERLLEDQPPVMDMKRTTF